MGNSMNKNSNFQIKIFPGDDKFLLENQYPKYHQFSEIKIEKTLELTPLVIYPPKARLKALIMLDYYVKSTHLLLNNNISYFHEMFSSESDFFANILPKINLFTK